MNLLRLSALSAALGLSMILAFGCDQKANSTPTPTATASHPVAVVDLDRVGKSLGWQEDMQRSINVRQQELQIEFNKLQGTLRDQVESQKKKLGDNPSKEDQAAFGQQVTQAENQLRQFLSQAEQDAQRVRLSMVQKYREQAKPIVKRIADARGFKVILLPSEMLFSYDDSCDITDQVIEEMRKSGQTVGGMSAPAAASQPATAAPAPAAAPAAAPKK